MALSPPGEIGEESQLFLHLNWEVITVDLADENRKTSKDSTTAIKVNLRQIVSSFR
jgi:hypothetical protein